MDELQEMREQMAALKEKLNKQEIVTEKLLKETIVGKMKRAKVWVLISVVILIICDISIVGLYLVRKQSLLNFNFSVRFVRITNDYFGDSSIL